MGHRKYLAAPALTSGPGLACHVRAPSYTLVPADIPMAEAMKLIRETHDKLFPHFFYNPMAIHYPAPIPADEGVCTHMVHQLREALVSQLPQSSVGQSYAFERDTGEKLESRESVLLFYGQEAGKHYAIMVPPFRPALSVVLREGESYLFAKGKHNETTYTLTDSRIETPEKVIPLRHFSDPHMATQTVQNYISHQLSNLQIGLCFIPQQNHRDTIRIHIRKKRPNGYYFLEFKDPNSSEKHHIRLEKWKEKKGDLSRVYTHFLGHTWVKIERAIDSFCEHFLHVPSSS